MELDKQTIEELLQRARQAREKAYAPYSHFYVGAALLAESGSIYSGSNIENASYGLTICAERTAIVKAVSEGERWIRAIAIIAGESEIARPCGACLQFVSEFSRPNQPTTIIAASVDGAYDIHSIDEYMPMRFTLSES